MIRIAMVSFLTLGVACGGSASNTATAPPPGPGDEAVTADADTGTEPTTDFASVAKVEVVNQPGQSVTLEDILVPGAVTVVDFYADWCGACKIMEEKLVEATADEPRIVVRKINIDDTETDVARQFEIGALPHMRLYGPDGKLAHVLIGNQALQAAALSRELL
jgi:thioredoxin 1